LKTDLQFNRITLNFIVFLNTITKCYTIWKFEMWKAIFFHFWNNANGKKVFSQAFKTQHTWNISNFLKRKQIKPDVLQTSRWGVRRALRADMSDTRWRKDWRASSDVSTTTSWPGSRPRRRRRCRPCGSDRRNSGAKACGKQGRLGCAELTGFCSVGPEVSENEKKTRNVFTFDFWLQLF